MANNLQTQARVAGALWLIVIVTGMFAFYVSMTLVVRGDAPATAARLLASEQLHRLGFTSNLVAAVCYMGVSVILYELLKSISRTQSMAAAFFGLAGVAVGGAAALADFAPMVLLRGDDTLSPFTPAQLQALAYAAVRVEAQFTAVGMVFFGCQCILAGILLARSTLVPGILGVLLAIGGMSYVINSFASFLAPAIAARIAFTLVAGFVGEGSLAVWLLAKGVRPVPSTYARASA